ncbi:MAG: formylglycine-generating enzyme family protein [Chloroflexi bacterium]|nr:formylglycine-generating enzyme family protein [Chloroflexota bacterium]MYD17069.1 formylglycine-generating enzyme family protein [Chloroflexota bacterium]MYJ02356.1 formylglycine-generating enzyme family protein [Chloroflexota bacterium]
MTTVLSVIDAGLVHLPGGRFVMGADDRRRDERPAHPVKLTPFRAAERPITNAQYAEFVKRVGAAPPPFWSQDGFCIPGAPVVGVSWHEAAAYCAWLSEQTGVHVRLPTEAEREFAARGGLDGADWPQATQDWPEDAIRAEVAAAEHPHIPLDACRNGFGLYCMADNVHEWCSDWYDRSYYAASPEFAPTGPQAGTRRASRGGSWRHRIKFTRVSARSSLSPSYRYNDYGFRVYADAE